MFAVFNYIHILDFEPCNSVCVEVHTDLPGASPYRDNVTPTQALNCLYWVIIRYWGEHNTSNIELEEKLDEHYFSNIWGTENYRAKIMANLAGHMEHVTLTETQIYACQALLELGSIRKKENYERQLLNFLWVYGFTHQKNTDYYYPEDDLNTVQDALYNSLNADF